jgi:hypothetical protein
MDLAALLQIAQFLAPFAKAAAVYRPSKTERAYRDYLEGQAKQLASGTGLGAGQRQRLQAEAAGQVQAAQQQATADLLRGQQGNLATSGQAQTAASAIQQQGQQAMNQAMSQIQALDAEAMKKAQEDYLQGLLNATNLEYQRRMAALGELEKVDPSLLAGASKSGQSLAGKQGAAMSQTAQGVSVGAPVQPNYLAAG